MKDKIKEIIKNKKILILGFGKEGQSTYIFLRKYFTNLSLTIADLNKDIGENPILKGDNSIDFETGEEYLKKLNEFDLIIKSPGISLNKTDVKINFEKITSQTDIFFNLFSKQIVGITGTKGKSTTSALLCHILESGRKDVVMAGNMGIPVFDIIEKIKKRTVIICETSSHQLEFIRKSPHIAILLNLYQEHLDYYKSYDEYKKAKLNIIKYQSENDFFIYNFDDAESRRTLEECRYKRKYIPYSFSEKVDNGMIISGNYVAYKSGMKEEKFFDLRLKKYLKGKHNLHNIMSAIAVCKILKIPKDIISYGIVSFAGLPHRMEYVGYFNGIYFYNDSISTIPEATIEAVEALKNVNTVIIGGFDRGIDYNKLIRFFEKNYIGHIVFIDMAGKRIMNMLKERKICNSEIFYADTLEDAVKISKEKTKEDTICLLSPAAASYGMFKNFEDRGEQFMKLVKG